MKKIAEMPDGRKFNLDEFDSLRLSGRPGYEIEDAKVMKSWISPGARVVDVGAHIGYHAIAFSKWVGEKGVVYAIEPDPETFRILCENVSLNKAKNVKPLNYGAGSIEESRIFWRSTKNTGDNRFYRDENSNSKPLLIPCVPIDKLVENEKIDFIKIDTQGMEIDALEGAYRVLHNPNIRMMVEFYPRGLRFFKREPAELIDFLKSRGFKISLIRRIKEDRQPLDLDELFENVTVEKGNHKNLFCERFS